MTSLPPHLQSLEQWVQASRFDAASPTLLDSQAHQHSQGQLVLALKGVVGCFVEDKHWLVPQHCALWIPPGIPHTSRTSSNAQGYFLFIEPQVTGLPDECCTLKISALLQELLIALADQSNAYSPYSRQLMTALLLNELPAQPRISSYFPVPRDPRLKRVADALMATPSDRRTLVQWCSYAGLSERTLARRLLNETGMSFSNWRRQLHLMVALEALSKGQSVQQIAADLGYEGVTGFITMFKAALGTTPAKYLSLFKPQAAFAQAGAAP
jgi:AraC-like DNA-binding protein